MSTVKLTQEELDDRVHTEPMAAALPVHGRLIPSMLVDQVAINGYAVLVGHLVRALRVYEPKERGRKDTGEGVSLYILRFGYR